MPENENLIETIQSSGFHACIAVAGGGSGAVQALLEHPGASRFILDVQIPYHREAMSEYLGTVPESFCSAQTARMMAETAFSRASHFSRRTTGIIGIACTAALRTVGDREDPDRACICFHSCDKVELHKIEFIEQTRSGQEKELSGFLIEQLWQFIKSSLPNTSL